MIIIFYKIFLSSQNFICGFFFLFFFTSFFFVLLNANVNLLSFRFIIHRVWRRHSGICFYLKWNWFPWLHPNIDLFLVFSSSSRGLQQVPVRVSRALRDQFGLLLSQQLPTHLCSRSGRTPYQLRLLGWGIWPWARQCHRVGGQPATKQPASVSRSDPAIPLLGLCQRLHQPWCAQQVQYQVHPQCDAQPAQHVRTRRRLQVQTDPHLWSLEPKPLTVFPRGHFIHWWVGGECSAVFWLSINLHNFLHY